jgi:hypothetical protein
LAALLWHFGQCRFLHVMEFAPFGQELPFGIDSDLSFKHQMGVI